MEVEEFFGYYDLYGEEDGEWVDEIYEEDEVDIFYVGEDVVINGDFDILEVWGGELILIVVDGSLSVNGKMWYFYYVIGDVDFDFLWMNVR